MNHVDIKSIEVTRNYAGDYTFCFCEDRDLNLAELYESTSTVENADAATPDRGLNFISAIQSRLPKFVYYSNYGNLDAQIYLPHVVDNMKRDDLGAKEAAKARTLQVLFKLVNLSPQEILDLANVRTKIRQVNQYNQIIAVTEDNNLEQIDSGDEQIRTRASLLQSASSKLTTSFKDWWKQGDYRFRLQTDGDYFRIWVSDDRRSEEIELENRSTGLQWFLSFFLIFQYEGEDAHINAIVLLDEPGHSLHPLAQRDLSFFLIVLRRHIKFYSQHIHPL